MRITYLHQYFRTPDEPGGTRSYEMAKRWVEAGHVVRIVTAREDVAPGRWALSAVDGIEVHAFGLRYRNEMGAAERIRCFLRFALASSRRAASLDADVVFATSTPLTIAIPAIATKLRRGIPMVFEVRDLWPEMPIAMGVLRRSPEIRLARWLERRAYGAAARVVALSPGIADGIAAAGTPRTRIAIVPNGCDIERFAAATGTERVLADHPELRDRTIVLYAGSIGVVNGLDFLVSVAQEMLERDPRVAVVILGSGAEASRVEKRARASGVLGRNLWIVPPVAKQEIPRWFALASVVASIFRDVPEMQKNSANKFFDGLAARRPVMLNYEGWQAGLVREHGAGLVVPAGDPVEAARRLAEFLSKAERVSAAGVAAGALAERRFERGALSSRLLALLEAVVVEARGDPARDLAAS